MTHLVTVGTRCANTPMACWWMKATELRIAARRNAAGRGLDGESYLISRQIGGTCYFCSSGTLATSGGAGRDWMNAWMFTRSVLDTTFSVDGGIWLVGRLT